MISGLNLGFDVFWSCFRSLEIWVSRVFWVFCDVDRDHVLRDRDQYEGFEVITFWVWVDRDQKWS